MQLTHAGWQGRDTVDNIPSWGDTRTIVQPRRTLTVTSHIPWAAWTAWTPGLSQSPSAAEARCDQWPAQEVTTPVHTINIQQIKNTKWDSLSSAPYKQKYTSAA